MTDMTQSNGNFALNRRMHHSRRSSFGAVSAVVVALWGLFAPGSAFAFTYTMPGPGKVSMLQVFPGTPSRAYYIVYIAPSGACTWTSLGTTAPNEDVVINGTSGTDFYVDYQYSIICEGFTVTYGRPDMDHDLEVYLKGGNDMALILDSANVHGGDGNDFLKDMRGAPFSTHPFGALYGDAGNDYLYSGTPIGGSGNDILCSTTAGVMDQWYADGGSGTDTFCGGSIYFERRISLENYRNGKCPAACQGLLGW